MLRTISHNSLVSGGIVDIDGYELPERTPRTGEGSAGHTRGGSASAVKLDRDILLAALEERSLAGDVRSQLQLGRHYLEHQQYDSARKIFELAAAQGNEYAKYQLGVIYYDGLSDIGEDHVRGMAFMRAVAESTNKHTPVELVASAQFNIGRAYFEGFGVTENIEDAARWWHKAARDGSPEGSKLAQCSLGLLYSSPSHQDLPKAFAWHRLAAENGHNESMACVGVMYQHGLGAEPSIDLALRWYKRGAKQGNVYAQAQLASFYYDRQMFTKCVEWATRAGEHTDVHEIARLTRSTPLYIRQGIAVGAFFMGRCHEVGQGIQISRGEAAKWYSKASTYDRHLVTKLRDRISFA